MPTPSSGSIRLSQVAAISKGAANFTVTLNEWETRYLAGIGSPNPIKMSNLYGKPVAGSALYNQPTYATNTWYSFPVPAYQYMTVDAMGGSGGGGGGSTYGNWYVPYYCPGSAGGAGGNSFINNVFGGGGPGGNIGKNGNTLPPNTSANGDPVPPGTATGGDFNNSPSYPGFAGGAGSNAPENTGGTGGQSGRAVKTYTHKVTGGYMGWAGSVNLYFGGAGGPGRATVLNFGACAWAGFATGGTAGYVGISWS